MCNKKKRYNTTLYNTYDIQYTTQCSNNKKLITKKYFSSSLFHVPRELITERKPLASKCNTSHGHDFPEIIRNTEESQQGTVASRSERFRGDRIKRPLTRLGALAVNVSRSYHKLASLPGGLSRPRGRLSRSFRRYAFKEG